jgi:Alpha-1,3-glucanase catalytic domain D1
MKTKFHQNVNHFLNVNMILLPPHRLLAETNRWAFRSLYALGVMVALMGSTERASAAGAIVPFTTYEAESGTPGGGASVVILTPPLSGNGQAVLESSGGAYVALTTTGHSVTWTNNTGQNITALNVRVHIPDAPAGGGITSTLNLYVNGVFRQAVNVNSKQTYLYGDDNRNKNPAAGNPTRIWDEYPFFVTGAAIAPGSTIKFQKDAGNSASFYNVDLVDLETPPAPLSQPANSLSITSYGAVANDPTVDNTAAIQNCMNAAQSQGKSVWIPAGTFYMGRSTTNGVYPTGITVAGAGMWYSILYSNPTNPVSGGQMIGGVSCTLKNFAMDSNSISAGCASASGISGSNWLVDAVWVRHLSLAVWGGGNNGTITNMRVNNTWSDGCNLNNFSGSSTTGSNLTEINNFLRFTGDDALAVNGTESSGYTAINGVTIANNTIVQTAGRIVVYGGNNITIKGNLCQDILQNDGIQVGYHQQTASIKNVMVVSNGPLLRCKANGHWPGHTFNANSPLEIEIEAALATRDAIPAIEIIKNGWVERAVPFEEWKRTGKLGKVKFTESGWFLVRAIADNPTTFRFASTAPFYVEIGDRKRLISRESAQFFLDWVHERMGRVKLEDETQRDEVLAHHRMAEKFWQEKVENANAR